MLINLPISCKASAESGKSQFEVLLTALSRYRASVERNPPQHGETSDKVIQQIDNVARELNEPRAANLQRAEVAGDVFGTTLIETPIYVGYERGQENEGRILLNALKYYFSELGVPGANNANDIWDVAYLTLTLSDAILIQTQQLDTHWEHDGQPAYRQPKTTSQANGRPVLETPVQFDAIAQSLADNAHLADIRLDQDNEGGEEEQKS